MSAHDSLTPEKDSKATPDNVIQALESASIAGDALADTTLFEIHRLNEVIRDLQGYNTPPQPAPTSDDNAVRRFALMDTSTDRFMVYMTLDPNAKGEWVRYEDYESQAAKIAELTEELRIVTIGRDSLARTVESYAERDEKQPPPTEARQIDYGMTPTLAAVRMALNGYSDDKDERRVLEEVFETARHALSKASPPPEGDLNDQDEYARCRGLSDEQIIQEAAETKCRLTHELGNRYDVVCEKLEQQPVEPTTSLTKLSNARLDWAMACDCDCNACGEFNSAVADHCDASPVEPEARHNYKQTHHVMITAEGEVSPVETVDSKREPSCKTCLDKGVAVCCGEMVMDNGLVCCGDYNIDDCPDCHKPATETVGGQS